MKTRFIEALGGVLLIALWCNPLHSQAPLRPSRIVLDAPRTQTTGDRASVQIRLLNAAGQPVKADRDLKFHVTAPGASLDHEIVVIPPGQDATQFTVTRTQAGVAEIRVEELRVPATIASAVTEIGFSSANVYTAVQPLSVSFTISPNNQLQVGESGRIVARLLDKMGVPVPAATNGLAISFPELSNLVSPHPLMINAGEVYGEATIRPDQVGTQMVVPVVVPPAFGRYPIYPEKLSVRFVSPIVGLRIQTNAAYVKSFKRPTFQVKIGLIDNLGNWINSDSDRTVILHTDPPDAGRLETSELTISRNTSVAETSYVPYHEGAATLNADAGGLQIQPIKVEFHYAWLYFAMISAFGGLAGGLVRQAFQKNYALKILIKGALVGLLLGVLLYILAPLLVSIGFKPEYFQNASKVLEAFVWGLIGGSGGIAVIAKLFKKWDIPLTANA